MDRRRILVLFAVAWVSAALLTFFLYAKTSAPKQEVRTKIIASTRDLAVGTMVRKADLKTVTVLPRDVPKGAVFTAKDALNKVVLYPVSANAPFISPNLSTLTGAEGIPATIEPGYRAVSITVSDVSGVAGLIQPGSHVDVLFTRPGTMSEALTSTILQNVRVLAIGHTVQLGQVVDPKAAKAPVATLVVTPDEAQKLELAKNEGRVSLTLRNPLDQSAGVDGRPVNTDVLDPSQRGRIVVQRMKSDPKAIEELRKPVPVAPKPLPPPAPRAVVDVFRGDKHVQEVFHE